MISEKLNIVNEFISKPKLVVFDFGNIFNESVVEEFFWIKAIENNQIEIFKSILKFKIDYFESKFLTAIKKSRYNNDTFFAIRFIKVITVELRNNGEDFTQLTTILDSLMDLVKTNDCKSNQLIWFITDAVLELPIEYFEPKHIHFIVNEGFNSNASLVGYSIEKSLLPRAIEYSKKEPVISIINDLILAFDNNDLNIDGIRVDTSLKSKIDEYSVAEIFNEENLDKIEKLIGFNAFAKILIDVITKISKTAPFEFSSFKLPSIEDTDQIWDKSSLSYIVIKVFRDLIQLKTPSNDFILNNLLFSDKTILQRIGLNTINYYFSEKGDLFWRWNIPNPLDINELKHEIFILLKNNCSEIKEKELNILFNWIDNIKYPDAKKAKSETEISRALIGKEYLAALKEISNPLRSKVAEKIKELDAIHPYQRENPGFNSYTTTKFGHDYPDSQEEFDKFTSSTVDLVNYILTNEQNWDIHELEGQRDRFIELFDKRPYLIDDFLELVKLDYHFLGNAIYGLQKSIENNKNLNWESLFNLIKKKLKQPIKPNEINSRDLFVGYCSWLIKTVARDDKRNFELQYLIEAKDICINFLKLDIRTKRRNKDPFFDILNSSEGKVLDAMLNVLLRNARLYRKNEKDKWFSDVKTFYTKTIQDKNLDDAYAYNIAGHLPQYAFLNIEWVKKNINYIFDKNDVDKWKLSMQSYTKMTSTVYKDLFDILLINGHYDYGIKELVDGEDGVSDFIQHVLVSYSANWSGQTLDDKDSLINKILLNSNKDQVIAIVNYFYTNSNYDPKKILPLWKVIFNYFLENENVQSIFVELLKLTSKIDYIDDSTFELIKETILKVDDINKLKTFSTKLLISKKDDCINRAKLVMLSTEKLPGNYFNEKSFSDFSKLLYNHDPKFGDEFVENLLNKGCFFLLDVYNENH